jgi:predicted enzyme related to lactoylglutathione lyase
MSRVVHFEVHAEDPKRAVAFYGAVFGWKVVSEMPGMDYHFVSTGEGEGIDGAIMKRMGSPPADGAAVNCFCCTLRVQDIEAAGATILAKGGGAAVPKMPVPGMGWVAYWKDTEGNIFGTWQDDSNAA